MKKIFPILFIVLIGYSNAFAATYSLPAVVGSNPFSCSGSGPVYTCNEVRLDEDSIITLTSDVTLNITGDFRAGEDFTVQANGFTLNINVTDDVRISSNANFTGNLTAGDDITIGQNSTITGNITAGDDVSISEDSTVNGNVTAADNLTLDQDTIVNGSCSPTHPQCTGVSVTPPGAGCDIFSDDFSSGNYSGGTANWLTDWVEDDDGSATNGDVRITGGRLMLRDDGSSIYRGADLSSYSSATLTFDYEENSLDNSSEYADLEVRTGGTGPWTFVQRFAGDPNDSGSVSIPVSSYLNANTQIRFVTPNGSMSNGDLFYVDNVRIEACTAGLITPEIDFHFDETEWTGVANEVLDNSANSYHASISSGSGLNTTTPGAICRAGRFDGINDYIVSNDIYSLLRTTASMSFWIKTTQTGNDTNWLAPGVAGIEQSGGGDDIFWGWLDASGHIGISKWDTPTAKSTVAINDGSYHHVVLTRDSPTGAYKIYIDGVLDASGTTGSGDVGTSFSSIGRIENTNGSAIYLQGDLDEFMVFDSVLSDAQVADIYTNQNNGNNYDGSPRACLDSPLAEWRFDESSWSGVAGEVVDTQGTFNATAVNGASTGGSNPAIAGDPGTCRYGVFDGSNDYVDLSSMSDLTGSFTITAWIYANETGKDQRIYVDDQNNSNGFALTLGDGGNGRLRFFSRSVNPIIVDTQNAVVLAGQWYHVAAVHDITAKTRQIFVNGAAVQLNTGSTSSTYSGTWGFDPGAASIGGENNSAGGEANANYRFNGNIDEIRVYEAPLSASQITTVMNQTRPCAVTTVDHFNINVGAGAASTCNVFEFTVTAEDSSNSTITDYTGSVSITTSTSHGNFTTVIAENNISPDPDAVDNGSAAYTFDALDTGSITLGLSNEHAETLSISVVDTSVASSLSTSSNVTFSDNAFVITDADTTLTGADNIPVAGRDHDYLVQMIRRDPNTGSCGVAIDYAGLKPLKMWRIKNGVDPSTLQPVLDGDALPDADPVVVNGDITFTAGEATVQLQTSDIGRYTLELADISNTFADTTIAGSSVEQIVRPFGLGIDFGSNLRDADFANGGLNGSNGDLSFALGNDITGDDGSLFTQAGNSFVTTIEGVLWQSEDDTDNNGVPDAGSYLGNNSPAPSFGQEGESVTVSGSNPVPGSLGNLTGTFFDNFVGGSQSQNMSYDNVGIFDLSAALSDGDYWGSGVNITGSAPNVGRFNPHHYTVTAAIVNDACGSFTYAGQTFDANITLEAQNLGNTRTDGYQGVYATLDIATELNVQNDATTAAFDTEVYTINESFSAGIMGQAQFDIDLSWNMPEQGETSSGVQILDSTDEVTLLSPSPTLVGSTDVRFGRLWLGNVFGSELIALTMPMRTQYYDGSNYILNTEDNCTSIDHNVAGEVAVLPSLSNGGLSAVSVNSIPAVGGILDVNLTAPGADSIGFVDVTPDLTISGETWLQYDWDSTLPGLENPTGRANFGIYNGDSRQIYIRQIY